MNVGPFRKWAKPSAEECREVTDALAELHGRPDRVVDPLEEGCGGQVLVLDSLVRTLLSQNTTDITSIRAFNTLKQRFPTWQQVLAAPNADVEDAIRVGGLAAIKCERMKALLAVLQEERGECCLEFLRNESTEAVKTFLRRFKGMGPKTISCVLLFCLSREDFPVDTHVLHIAKAMGWLPQSASREQAYEHLNARVPDDVKFELHVLLVEHGKKCGSCSKNGRGSKDCPLSAFRGSKGKAMAAVAAGGKGSRAAPAKRKLAVAVKEEKESSKRRVAVKIEEDFRVKEEEVVVKEENTPPPY